MQERIEKRDLVRRVAMGVNRDEVTVGEIVEVTLEEIYGALKRGESVSLRDFGSFYVRPERESRVFKFNPPSACASSLAGPRPIAGRRSVASFEQTYPHIARWVKGYGWIELGSDGMSPSWVRALDEGGLIWEGGDPSQSLDDTLKELDTALATWLRRLEGRGEA